MKTGQLKAKWGMKCKRFLEGKTIKEVRYQTTEEMEAMGWYSAALVIWFTDGSFMFPSRDDEGNDAGALFTSDDDLMVIPVI